MQTKSKPIWLNSVEMLFVSLMLALGALLLVGLSENSVLATLILWLVCGATGMLLLTVERIIGRFPKPLIRQFLVTFSWRIIVMTLLHTALNSTVYGPWWNFGAHGGDELGFWDNSDRLALAWQYGTILQEKALQFDNYFVWLQIVGFVRFVGRRLGGETVFNVRLVLCMASAMIVPYVYAITLRLFDERVARTAASLAFWLPDYWFYSSTLLRDVLISCIIIIIFYYVIAMVEVRFHWWHLVLSVVLNFGVLRYLRGSLVYINVGLVVPFAIRSYLGRRRRLISQPYVTVLLAFVVLGVLSIMAYQAYFPNTLSSDRFLSKSYLEYIATMHREAALEEAELGSFGARLLRLPIYLRVPIGAIVAILQPIPPWGALHDLYGGKNMFPLKAAVLVVSALVWYGMVVFLPIGFIGCLSTKSHRTVWVWGTALILALLFGVASAQHPRWRLMLMPFLLIMIGHAMHNWREHRLLLKYTVNFIIGGLGVYCVLKYFF